MPLPLVIVYTTVSVALAGGVTAALARNRTRVLRAALRRKPADGERRLAEPGGERRSLSGSAAPSRPPAKPAGTVDGRLALAGGAFGLSLAQVSARALAPWAVVVDVIAFVPVWREGGREMVALRPGVNASLGLLTAGLLWQHLYLLAAFGNLLFRLRGKMVVLSQEWALGDLEALFDAPVGAARRVRDGVVETVAAAELRPGDSVEVRAGAVVPADGGVVGGRIGVDRPVFTGGPVAVECGVDGEGTVSGQMRRAVGQGADSRRRARRRRAALVTKTAPVTIAAAGGAWLLLGPTAALGVIASVPGLSLPDVVPLGPLSNLRNAARNGVLVKDDRAFELLHRVDTIVFEKSGTLTVGRPTVSEVRSWSAQRSAEDILSLAALAERGQDHPIARAILAAAGPPAVSGAAHDEAGSGVGVRCGLGHIRVGSARYMRESGLPLPPIEYPQPLSTTRVYVAVDGSVVGRVVLDDPLRSEAASCIEALRRRGYRCVVLSGDDPSAVADVAHALGIEDHHGGLLPEDKAGVIGQYRRAGHRVAFVGDGASGVGVLRAADVAISLAGAGTVAADAAAIVLPSSDLSGVLKLFDGAHEVRQREKVATAATVGLPVVGLAAAFSGTAFAVPLALLFQDLGYWGGFVAQTLPRWEALSGSARDTRVATDPEGSTAIRLGRLRNIGPSP